MQPARRRTALAGILAAVFVSGTGIGSILPILPLYLRERGASYALVGVVVAAALVAQAVGQWTAGWLADRLGRREMMVAGVVLGAVCGATGAGLAAAALVAAVALGPSPRRMAGQRGLPVLSLRAGRGGQALRGVLILTAGVGLLAGIYDVIWSLYMRAIGASDPVIGLSFSLWALPLVIVTPLAGWASDRWDRRWLAAGSVGLTAMIGPFYPLLHNIPVVMAVGAVEAG